MRSKSLCLVVGLALAATSPSHPFRRAAAAESSAGPAQPATGIVQTVTAADFPGLSKSLLKPTAAAVHKNRLYLANDSGIAWFWRDERTGKLRFEGEVPAPSGGVRKILLARGTMHTVGTEGKGLAWHLLDWRNGKPERKGEVPCPSARQMFTNLSQEDIYVKTCGDQEGKLLWYRTGYWSTQPVPAGEVTGKGLKETGRDGGATLQTAPNLRHLYCISLEDRTIACIDRKPNGQIAYQSAIDFEPLARRGASYRRAALACSPDGYWLYAHLWNGNPKENCYGVFRRDPFSGKLSLKETISGDKDPLANVQTWAVVFTPNGADGYLIDAEGRVQGFKYDPQTGHFGQRTAIQELKGHAAGPLVLDPITQCLYVFADGTLTVYQGEKVPRRQIVLKTTPLGDDFFAKRDDTVVAWLGMSSVVVNSRGTVIMVDPLITLVERNGKLVNECNMPQKVPLPIQSDKVPRLDAVCYTHGHADHFQLPTPKVLEARLKPLFFGGGVEGELRKAGIDEKRVITAEPWQSYRVGDIELCFTPCKHCAGATGYLMKTPDGTIWAPGDTEFIDDLLKVRGVDLLLFDVPGTGGHLGPEGSSRLAESCGAKLMVAEHYGTVDTTAEWLDRDPLDALPFVRDLKAKYVTPGPGEVIKLPLGK